MRDGRRLAAAEHPTRIARAGTVRAPISPMCHRRRGASLTPSTWSCRTASALRELTERTRAEAGASGARECRAPSRDHDDDDADGGRGSSRSASSCSSLAFYGAGGYHFSNVIDERALDARRVARGDARRSTPTSRSPPRRRSSDRCRSRSPFARSSTDLGVELQGLQGLRWNGGYGRIAPLAGLTAGTRTEPSSRSRS